MNAIEEEAIREVKRFLAGRYYAIASRLTREVIRCFEKAAEIEAADGEYADYLCRLAINPDCPDPMPFEKWARLNDEYNRLNDEHSQVYESWVKSLPVGSYVDVWGDSSQTPPPPPPRLVKLEQMLMI